MPSSSNEKLFWADRKNRMEKSRLDLILKNMEREQMYLAHDIDREKRAVIKNLSNVKRTSGVSDQGVPPRDDKDLSYQTSPNYRMGIRLSERRLLEWRENEKQLEKFMNQSTWDLAKLNGKHRRHSSPEGSRLLRRKSSGKKYSRSASSIGGYTDVRVLDDDVFTNGSSITSSQRSDSVVNLDPREFEQQIFRDYKDSVNKTKIPSTSDVLKMKKVRQFRSEGDIRNSDKKQLRFRPHTVSVASHSERKSVRKISPRPATAQCNFQTNEKTLKETDNKLECRDELSEENFSMNTPTKPMMNNFMPTTHSNEPCMSNVSTNVDENCDYECDEMSDDESEKVLNRSTRDAIKRFQDMMPEVENKFKGTYINSSITIVYDEETEKVTEIKEDMEGGEGEEVEGQEEDLIENGRVGYTVEDYSPTEYNENGECEKESSDLLNSENWDCVDKSKISSNADCSPSPCKSMDESPMSVNQNDTVVPLNRNDTKLAKVKRKPSRVLTGIDEDKVLTIEEDEILNENSHPSNGINGDDTVSIATHSTSSRMTSRQRRVSTASSITHSDRYSVMYGSISDIYSIGSDGQRRPSKWRQYVAADTAPVPQKKMVTVTAVVRAALAFSKLARKRALDKLVDEQSTDPRELIRQERLRRLHSRNNILQTITSSWTLNEGNSIQEVEEQA